MGKNKRNIRRKNMLRKYFFMEIRKSANRFISIFLIVTMGVAFFSAIWASEPDMRYSADEYYDTHGLMDIRIMGTMGLTDEDVSAVAALDGVYEVRGGSTRRLRDFSLWGDARRFLRLWQTWGISIRWTCFRAVCSKRPASV